MEQPINLLKFLQEENQIENKTEVDIVGAVNVDATPMTDFKVKVTTGDLTLIIAVLHDYVR